MKISKFFREHLFIFFVFILLFIAGWIKSTVDRPIVFISKQDSSLNLNYQFLKYINLGHKRLLSSLVWTATILESDIDHYKKKDLNSWMFQRFDTISKLEPNFLPTYTFGGTYLSIVKDDLEGASIIYKTGINVYPENYELISKAAYHFHFEVGDYDYSYQLFKKLKNSPKYSKFITPSLAKLEIEKGNLEAAFEILKDQYDSFPDKNAHTAEKIFTYLYAIRAEMDLNCLNNKLKNCKNSDLESHPYLNKGGLYYAIKNWVPYRLRKKKK